MLKKLRRKVYRKIRFQTWYRKAYYYHRKRRDQPVCPEVLGGLPTPRVPSEIRGGRVVAKDGTDVTGAFTCGAEEALRLALENGCTAAILKARSPSCGSGEIYDGSFTGTRVPGEGVFARMARKAGLEIWSEETFTEAGTLFGG